MTSGAPTAVVPDTASDAAIRAAVDSVLADPDFAVGMVDSLLGRLARLIGQALRSLLDAARDLPGGGWTALAVVVLLAAVLVARIIGGARSRVDAHRTATVRQRASLDRAAADALAARGDHTAAAHVLYAAALGRLQATDGIRLDPSLTGGDYARRLRRLRSPAAPAFAAFVRRYDRIIYGAGTCTPEEYRRLSADADPLFDEARAA